MKRDRRRGRTPCGSIKSPVKPQKNRRFFIWSANTYEDTEYYTWPVFDVKPVFDGKPSDPRCFIRDSLYRMPSTKEQLDSLEHIFSSSGFGIEPVLTKEKLTLAAWRKMPDNEMYEGHNDLAVTNSVLIASAAEKLSDIAEILNR